MVRENSDRLFKPKLNYNYIEMKTLRIIRNTSGAFGLMTATILADSMDATGKEILASVVLAVVSIVILLLPEIEKELRHQN